MTRLEAIRKMHIDELAALLVQCHTDTDELYYTVFGERSDVEEDAIEMTKKWLNYPAKFTDKGTMRIWIEDYENYT